MDKYFEYDKSTLKKIPILCRFASIPEETKKFNQILSNKLLINVHKYNSSEVKPEGYYKPISKIIP